MIPGAWLVFVCIGTAAVMLAVLWYVMTCEKVNPIYHRGEPAWRKREARSLRAMRRRSGG